VADDQEGKFWLTTATNVETINDVSQPALIIRTASARIPVATFNSRFVP